MPLIKHNILERVDKYWRSFKNRIKQEHYVKKIGTPARWVCGDNDVDAEQWREMVKYWDKEKTTVSDINTSRKDLVVKYFLYVLLN